MTRTAAALFSVVVIPLTLSAQGPAGGAPHIPLREGLTIVTALHFAKGDYESIKRVTDADAAAIKVAYSTDRPPRDDDDDDFALLGGDCVTEREKANPGKTIHWTVDRSVRRDDLEKAHEYKQRFDVCSTEEESFPGSTALGISSTALRELNAAGHTTLSVMAGGLTAGSGDLLGMLTSVMSKEAGESEMASGVLTRVERGSVPFKVLVNDELVELPAVHARGTLGDEPAEFWILDDAANPLSLRWSLADGKERLEVIKLSFPITVASPSNAGTAAAAGAAAGSSLATNIERDLAKDGRAVVYGIYFDFAKDTIKPESDAVMAEIGRVLAQNPGWKLTVEGHTDSIGGDIDNLDLSKRRAAAVKQALVTRYKVDGARLQTSGYGASRPKDTNETLEGRARNRRVELAKAG